MMLQKNTQVIKMRNILLILALFYFFNAFAADDNNPIPLLGQEPGVSRGATYQTGLSGIESVNIYSGTLSLTYKDIVIPGEGGFDITVYRTYNTPSIQKNFGSTGASIHGAGWDMHMGRILQLDYPGTCQVSLDDSSKNPVLELPDGRREVLYNAIVEYGHDFITKSLWVADCRAGGDGFDVYSPAGVKYTMNHFGYAGSGDAVSVSRIEDRNGNYLTVEYSHLIHHGQHVIKNILSSDLLY